MSYEYVTNQGVILARTDQVLDNWNDQFKTVFGDDFVTYPSTPEGGFIAMFANAEMAVNRGNAAIATQLNPDYSGGSFQDAICALFDTKRTPSVNSKVTIKCTGVANTNIPSGRTVRDDNGHYWSLDNDALIDASGVVFADFTCLTVGPIEAGIGTITQIAQGVLGWETANNEGAASIGKLEQSDQSLARFRKLQLGNQGRRTVVAIKGNLSKVDGFGSMSFRENRDESQQVIDNITMKPKSIYVCVDGGTDLDVAEAIKEAASDGAGFNGSTSQSVKDPVSGQSEVILFDRPAPVNVDITIGVRIGSANITTQAIKKSVIDYANGLVGDSEGFVVGADVSPFDISAAVSERNPGLFVGLCTVAKSGGTQQPVEIEIKLNEIAKVTEGNIKVNFL